MTSLTFKTPPRPYQLPVLKERIIHRGGGLYVPMRYGKSWLAINWAGAMHLKYGAKRVLVVCPNDVVDVWIEQIKEHCSVPANLLLGDLEMYDMEGLTFHIRNYESIFARVYDDPDNRRAWTGVTDQRLLTWRPETMIVDEAHHIGNPTGLQSKKLYQIARQTKFRLFMTGTPFHRKPFYVFGQFRFYDDSVFGTNFGQFKRQVAVFGGYGNYEVKRYQNLKWLREKIKPHVSIAKRVPHTPPTIRRIRFGLEESRGSYDEMLRESYLEIGGHEITAPIVLTRHLRLRQICGGWLRSPEGRYVRVGREKRRAFDRRVKEYIEQDISKFVVGCRFIPEIRDAYDVVKANGLNPYLIHGGVPREERTARRKRFAADPNGVVVAQFRAAKEGIDLSTADLMVFYSLPEGYLTYDQFKSRIEKYAEKRSLLYEFLIAKGTEDETAFEALSFHENVAKYILSRPKLVERLSIR